MRARKTTTEVRQEQIAQAALKVVERHGLRGLNVARVAAIVGVVPSGLYRHYAGKAEVLNAVLEAIAAGLAANVARARAAGRDALDRLHRLLTLHLEMVRDRPGIPRVVFSEELLHGDPALRRRLGAILGGYLGQVESLLREGQQEGCIRAGPLPETGALLFLGLIQPAIMRWTTSAGAIDLAAHAEAVWPLFVRAVGNPTRTSNEPPPSTLPLSS